jgi:hypothetical protein
VSNLKPTVMPNIPVTTKVGGQTVSTQRMVQQPTEREVNHFSNQRVKTCATCKSFQNDEKTNAKIRDTDFWRKIRFDYKWRAQYLPGKAHELGLCAQSNGERMVGPTSGACDLYKLRFGR